MSIVNDPKNSQSLIGVVLDVTGAYKTYDSKDYVTKLKVIDSSFNYKSNTTEYKSFLHVFVYSNTIESGLRANRVGDIVKLTTFDVLIAYSSSDNTRIPKSKVFSMSTTLTGLFSTAERTQTS